MSDVGATAALQLSRKLREVIAGHSPELQGAALADLLSIWLAGHLIVGDPEATSSHREELLQLHIGCVRDLIPDSEIEIGVASLVKGQI